MKQIFTLSIAFILFSNMASAQSQNFNDPAVVTTLQSNCWNFYGMSYTSAAPVIEGAGQLYIIAATSTSNNAQANSNTGQLATPYINFNQGATLSFKYRLSGNLNNNATRYITVRLYDGTNSTTINTITINGGTTSATTYNPSFTIPANSGVKRLIIDFTGNGDGNTGMYFDLLTLTSSAFYSYNASNCSALVTTNAPLPVRLINFTGNVLDKKANLSWTVAQNEDGNQFILEKSTDGKSFTTAAIVIPTGKNGEEGYRYTDASFSGRLYYRLKIVNADRSASYSKTLFVQETETAASSNLSLLQNPVASTLSFSYTASADAVNTVTLYNYAGAKVYTTHVGMHKGTNTANLSLDSKIPSGTYILEITDGNSRSIAKLVKQ